MQVIAPLIGGYDDGNMVDIGVVKELFDHSEMPGQEVLAEEFRRVCEARGVTPEHHNGWGALTMALAGAGTITETGRLAKSQSPRSHARKQPVWRVGWDGQ